MTPAPTPGKLLMRPDDAWAIPSDASGVRDRETATGASTSSARAASPERRAQDSMASPSAVPSAPHGAGHRTEDGRDAASRHARMRLPIRVYRQEAPIRPRPTLVSLLIATGLAAAPVAPTVAVAAPRVDRGGHSTLQRAVVRSVNSARARHGLPPVRVHSRLTRASSAHSADQLRTGRASHESADGTPCRQRLRRYSRARRTGETIVWLTGGQRVTARRIVRMWLASRSHRRVLMDPRFRRIGVGVRSGNVRGHATTVVTADFASAR